MDRIPRVNYLYDTSIVLDTTKPYCLSFWYYMWGTDVGRLRVNYGNALGVWSREGNYGERWLHGQVMVAKGDIDFSTHVSQYSFFV